MTIKFSLIFILTFYALGYWSQKNSQQLVDFQKELTTYREDTNKIKKIIEFVQSQDELNHSSFKYLQEALRLSNKLKYTQGQYATNVELCYYFSNVQVNNVKAMKAANNAVILAEKTNSPKKLIEAYQLIGHYYRNVNKNRQAVEYMLKALNVANKTRNPEASFTLNNDLGMAHPNSDTALIYFKKSLRILDSIQNFDTKAFGGRSKKELRGIVLNNMGGVYSRTGKSAPTVRNVEASESLNEKEKKDNISSTDNSVTATTENTAEKKENKKKEKAALKEIDNVNPERNDQAAKKEDTLVHPSNIQKTKQITSNTSENSKTIRFIFLLVLCLAALVGAYYYKRKKRES